MSQLKHTKKEPQSFAQELNPYKGILRDTSFLFEDKVMELSLLKRVSDILEYIIDLEPFYRMFADILLEETDAENCSFMLKDSETNTLFFKMARGRNDDGTFFDYPEDSGVTFSLDEGIAGKVTSERKTILIGDVSADKFFETRETRYPIGSLICTPLIFKEKVLGVINLSHPQPHMFNRSNKRIMELLCAFVSALLSYASDYIKVKDQEKFKAMFEGVRLSILLIDPETTKIVDCNRYTEEWLNYSKVELIHMKHATDIILPGYREEAGRILHEIIEGNDSEINELSFIKKDGSSTIGEISGTTISYQGKNVVQITSRDITEKKKAEESLRKSEERYYNLIDFANIGIIVAEDDKITQFNKKAEAIYGYSKKEILGQSPTILTPEKYRKKHIEILNDIVTLGKVDKMIFEEEGIRKDGSLFPLEISFSLTQPGNKSIIAAMTDITERKKIEKILLQSEKLKSLGELAGGVAHDFNNVLSAILGRAQLLKMHFETPPGVKEKRQSMLELQEGLEVIEKASKDGAETVRRIQEFCRRRDDDKYFSSIDLNEIIDDALDFTKMKWKNDAESNGLKITIEKEFSSLPATSGSAAELREVFTNLINNAIDAMPQGGDIKVKTCRIDSHIVIKVEDTGIGIPASVRDRIFDPFFTTKGVKSTGLGMSVSYGIINRHRGTIGVDSVEGQGTTFTIKIPVRERAVEEKEENPTSIEIKKARILVIEDEEGVRNLLSAILKKGGHEVETATCGDQGIEIYEKNQFDLVFTDLGMPGMSGWQVAEKVKSINGRVPVVLITGWDIRQEATEMKDSYVDLIVHKPFEMDQVLSIVQEGMILRNRLDLTLK